DAFRGVVRRIEEQHERRVRRAEREFLDAALLALASYQRDVALVAVGGDRALLVNVDRADEISASGGGGARGAAPPGALRGGRGELADETNLNARLVLERLFLRLAPA